MGKKLGEALSDALGQMILSAAGWRGVFADDGEEESSSSNISPEHKLIAASAARVFSDYLSNKLNKNGSIIVGRDTRPTGTAITDEVLRSLLSAGRKVLYLGITAAPEIMAYTKAKNKEADVSGFIYISASHNPIGHNGIKFGLSDGALLPVSRAKELISDFRTYIATTELESFALVNATVANDKDLKKEALTAYRSFIKEVIAGTAEKTKTEEFWAALKKGIEKRPLGIVTDFNGSARTLSIDKDFFASVGINFHSINNKPGEITGRIIPEEESLEHCRVLLEELHRKDPSFILGYKPDCDGDRGNLVFWDDQRQKARILEAQEVFALACVGELSSMVWSGELQPESPRHKPIKTAVVANDPTSLRIDRIAGAFGVKVFRAEVGEANVVGLARKLREEGWLLRFLGEGSVGGIIIHPSEVRDPLTTLGAILKLLLIRSENGHKGPFEIWCKLSGQDYREDFTLTDIIASLPPFTSTGTSTEDANFKVKTTDHSLLKEKYQMIFLREWEDNKACLLKNYGICEWEAIAYNGTEERRGIKKFSEAGTGGLKIAFSGGKAASIWMRGSQTEPIFRIMADVEGSNTELERTLINWQRRMVLEADQMKSEK